MKDGWPEAGSVNCEREPVAYATDATVPRVSAPGDREFSAGHQPCRWPGSSAIARTHSRVFFPDQVYSPSRSFQFCTPTVTISISFTPTTPRPPAYAPAPAVSHNNKVFSEAISHSFRVLHPALRQFNLIAPSPQRAATCWNWAALVFAHRWLSHKGGASSIQPRAPATPNSTALPRSLLSPSPPLDRQIA